jgi:hypothetical protein
LLLESLIVLQFGEIPSREALALLVAKRDEPTERLYVFFPEGDIGVPQCKKYVEPAAACPAA